MVDGVLIIGQELWGFLVVMAMPMAVAWLFIVCLDPLLQPCLLLASFVAAYGCCGRWGQRIGGVIRAAGHVLCAVVDVGQQI
jgi:hypothetical protein